MKRNILEEIFSSTPKSLQGTSSNRSKIKNSIPLDLNDLSYNNDLKVTSYHLGAIACLVLFGFLFLFARVLNIQLVQKGALTFLSDQNRIREYFVEAERGVIYDLTGQVIARNRPAFGLTLDLQVCKDSIVCIETIKAVNQRVPLDLEDALPKVNSALSKQLVLTTNMTKDDVVTFEPHLKDYPGVSIFVLPQRDYLFKDAFAHSVGYVGLDDQSLRPSIVGKMGIEETYDSYLKGIPGAKIVQTNSQGLEQRTLAETQAFSGKNVHLYLDTRLQTKAYELAKKVVDDKKGKGVAVVAQDPRTGGVLALTSYPSFDPDKLSAGITSKEFQQLIADPGLPFFDRAISGAYPPGSVFKMPVASAVLAENVIDEYTTINDPGYIQVGSYIFRNWNTSGHGLVDMRRALQVSNDTYFYTVGGGYGSIKGLGIDRLSTWVKKFGYGSTLGIDIKGEVGGFIPDAHYKDWYLGDTYISSIGQGDVLATPLQVNAATTYFANDGRIFKPKLVKSIDGVGDLPTHVLAENLISTKIHTIVKEGMKLAVSPGGTGYPVYDFPQKYGIELAGKTGTAEYIASDGKPATHAWFTIFGPYDDASIALTVFVEGGASGADDAAPLARELLNVWFADKKDNKISLILTNNLPPVSLSV